MIPDPSKDKLTLPLLLKVLGLSVVLYLGIWLAWTLA